MGIGNYRDVFQLEGDPILRCPRCRQMRSASMLRDIRMLREPARGGFDFHCDGCEDGVLMRGLIDHADYFRDLGLEDEHIVQAIRRYK